MFHIADFRMKTTSLLEFQNFFRIIIVIIKKISRKSHFTCSGIMVFGNIIICFSHSYLKVYKLQTFESWEVD